jgi:hypothetical protein
MFRAPEWSINDRSLWALEILVEEGISVDASMAPVRLVGAVTYPRHPHLRQTVAGPITEVPPLVVDRFGQTMPMGWGWGLRMSSPRRVVRAIEAVNHAGVPAVLMVHPWSSTGPAASPPACETPVRPLLPAQRLPGAAARRAARRPVRRIGDMAGALVR